MIKMNLTGRIHEIPTLNRNLVSKVLFRFVGLPFKKSMKTITSLIKFMNNRDGTDPGLVEDLDMVIGQTSVKDRNEAVGNPAFPINLRDAVIKYLNIFCWSAN